MWWRSLSAERRKQLTTEKGEAILKVLQLGRAGYQFLDCCMWETGSSFLQLCQSGSWTMGHDKLKRRSEQLSSCS